MPLNTTVASYSSARPMGYFVLQRSLSHQANRFRSLDVADCHSALYRPPEHLCFHDDAIKWKQFLRHWPFVRVTQPSPVDSPHKGQWRGTLMFSVICAWTNDWANNRDTGDLRRHCAHHDVTIISKPLCRWDRYTLELDPFVRSWSPGFWRRRVIGLLTI